MFNNQAWNRAKNVLREIIGGLAADPPGVQFYYQALNVRGELAFDEHKIPLLDCSRGSNDVENSHKIIVTTFGTWCTGVQMADALLAERRHRYNHNISERRRSGFPKIGHYDTWLIDHLNLLVEDNHNVLLYPSWSNTSDCAKTKERFGTVSIHSHEVGRALATIKLDSKAKFTDDQQYLCDRMGTKAPLLPVHGEKECALFAQLIRTSRSDLDMDKMAIEWCSKVDGINIFPKLPVYLRIHFASWTHNQQVKETVKNVALG